MGYRIVYQQSGPGESGAGCRLGRTGLFCLFFLLFTRLVGTYWEEGSLVLDELIRSSKLRSAAQAAEALAFRAGSAGGMEEAWQVFREQLTEGFGYHVS